MKILAIETSTMLGGVAIVDSDKGLISETRLNVKTTHSERLMSVISAAMDYSGLVLNDIDAFAVAIGPGSFTGLRIGLSTVKGLAYATDRPIVTIPTLEAFAHQFAWSSYPVCLMLDARRQEVYSALFEWGEHGVEKRISEISIKPEVLLQGLKGPVIFAGEGALLYKNMIMEIIGARAIIASPERMVPSPASLAILGLRKAEQGEYTEASKAVPMYIRKSEAEVKWKGKT